MFCCPLPRVTAPRDHLCKDILEAAGLLPPPGAARLDVQIGKRKVFMRNPVFNALEPGAGRDRCSALGCR